MSLRAQLIPFLALSFTIALTACPDSESVDGDEEQRDGSIPDVDLGRLDVGPFDLGIHPDASVPADDAATNPDAACPDGDNDGVCDGEDACPAGDDRLDRDNDGVADACDLCPDDNPNDSDGDSVCDSADACPGSDDRVDTDLDGVADGCDVCANSDDRVDTDGDGVADGCDKCPADNPDDTDGDTACDSADQCAGGDDRVDSDLDGVPDACDACPLDNPDDTDLDTVCDSADVCALGDDLSDVDGDTTPDACDACPNDNPDDSDGDGVCNSADVCALGPDGDDLDLDGVADACDNCPDVENPGQENTDGIAAVPVPFQFRSPANQTFVSLFDDQVGPAIPLGFTFDFFGRSYTEVAIVSNGFLTFTATTANQGCCAGGGLPSFFEPNNLIALSWTDLNPSAGGVISYATTGTTAAHELVVTFDSVPLYASTSTVTVQAVLFEGTNRIEIHTLAQPGGRIFTRGIEDAPGRIAAYIRDEVALDFALVNDGVAFTTATSTDAVGDACSNAFYEDYYGGYGGYGGYGPVETVAQGRYRRPVR